MLLETPSLRGMLPAMDSATPANAPPSTGGVGYPYQRTRYFRKVPAHLWEHVDWAKPAVVIARELGVSRSLVHEHRKRLGIAPPRRAALLWEARQKVLSDLPKMLSLSRIAALLGVTESRACEVCRQHDYAYSSPTQEKRAAQFRDLPPGLTTRQVASQLRISYYQAQYWAAFVGYHLADGRRLPANIRRNRETLKKTFRRMPPGLTLWEVMKRVGRCERTARYWCRAFGYRCRGERYRLE